MFLKFLNQTIENLTNESKVSLVSPVKAGHIASLGLGSKCRFAHFKKLKIIYNLEKTTVHIFQKHLINQNQDINHHLQFLYKKQKTQDFALY